VAVLVAVACSSAPTPGPDLADSEVILEQARVVDARARFREIFCAVLAAHGPSLPDDRPCDEALARLGDEPGGTGAPVVLGPSSRHLVVADVPGIGWGCFSEWLHAPGTTVAHLRRFGYDMVAVEVGALSSTTANARQVRDAVMAMGLPDDPTPRLVLLGYSKGTIDILEAVVSYPEMWPRIAAVVSVSGAVGGSPLAVDVRQEQLELLKHWPDSRCGGTDSGAMESLHPDVRRAWLAENRLPEHFPYYSLASCPDHDHVSAILRSSYRKLSEVDPRNDGMVLFRDQLIPGSTFLGAVNADHWAVSVPISRSHPTIASTLVTHNDFPREALAEALLRFVEEDLGRRTPPAGPSDDSGFSSVLFLPGTAR